MNSLLGITQIIVSILLISAILLQQRGAGSSAIMGGGGAYYYTKRGFEKVLFILTIILAILFLGLTFFNLLIKY